MDCLPRRCAGDEAAGIWSNRHSEFNGGQRGEANVSNYAASKGGQISFTKSLAAELAPFGINVNCVAPGWVETDMNDGVFADKARLESILANHSTAKDRAARGTGSTNRFPLLKLGKLHHW